MAETLTPKQERFAREYVKTGSQAEAYRRAYDAENMKPETIRRKAYDLAHNGNVAATVASISQATNERFSLTAEQLTRDVYKLATDPEQKGSTRVAAYALLARAMPEYNERRVDVHVSGAVDVRALLALRSELAALQAGQADPELLEETLSKPLLIDISTEQDNVMTSVDSGLGQ